MQISLDKLFLEAFGYESPAFKPNVKPVSGDVDFARTEYGKIAGSPYYAKDMVGREYYLPIEVQVGNETIPNTNTTYAQHLGVTDAAGAYTGRWMLPYPVMSIGLNFHIIDTALTERNGPVSELINVEGYKITVRGFLINKAANEAPENDFTTLIRLCECKIPIRMKNPLTDVLLMPPGSTEPQTVTIRNLQFPERPGVKSVKPYVLELWSNEDYNLIDIS